jgi:hypothetical protein
MNIKLYEKFSRVVILLLILLSLVFYLIILIGSAIGSIDLNKFTFDEPISAILQRKNIKFTLSDYCIDDRCLNDETLNTKKGK